MAKDESAAIEKLVLNLGGTEVSLTITQARKLFDALNNLFGNHAAIVYQHYPNWWYQPTWIWPNQQPRWAHNGVDVSYQNSSNTLCCSVD